MWWTLSGVGQVRLPSVPTSRSRLVGDWVALRILAASSTVNSILAAISLSEGALPSSMLNSDSRVTSWRAYSSTSTGSRIVRLELASPADASRLTSPRLLRLAYGEAPQAGPTPSTVEHFSTGRSGTHTNRP